MEKKKFLLVPLLEAIVAMEEGYLTLLMAEIEHTFYRHFVVPGRKVKKDGQKKNEETIFSVASEIKSTIEGLRSKIEKDSQSFAKALSKSSKEYKNSLKSETVQALLETSTGIEIDK
ncbi:hypothetical protein E2542_SST17271 [Spatholobus suberectus]|nr:hypothetical protein E2542_SST17271 [Spatholobus suberectus]